MNGITGLKPTWGRVSRAGVFALAQSMDHIGPMTRSAADAAAMLRPIAGADIDDPTASHEPVADYLGVIGQGVRDVRVGIDRTLIAAATDADMVRATKEATRVLSQVGAKILEVSLPCPNAVVRDWIPLCAVEAAVAHDATYPARAAEYGPLLASLLETGRSLDGRTVAKMQLRREIFRSRLNALFGGIDLLIVPVMNVAAPTLADLAAAGRAPPAIEARLRFTAPFDMSGHPTLTLPGGATNDGLPVGFQIVGRPMQEALILRAGQAFQQATSWHKRRPPIA
jgi:amidase